ncbi:MAG: T9SS type A sorting domain-containing protein [Gemmatimonadales bacterium]|nr:T9SS type A sorting domain-containing protein [Gemmatimonadales bacterium]
MLPATESTKSISYRSHLCFPHGFYRLGLLLLMITLLAPAFSVQAEDCEYYQSYLHPISRIEPPGRPYQIALAGELAYVPSGGGCHVIDLSTPSYPVLLHTFLSDGLPSSVLPSGDLLYLIEAGSGLLAQVQTFDVSDPTDPIALNSVSIPGYGGKMLQKGDLLYVGNSYGLHFLDLEDPKQPVLLNSLALNANHIVFFDDLLLCGGTQLNVIDGQDPLAPVVIAELSMPSGITGLSVSDQTVFVSLYTDGLQVVDLSSPEHPEMVSSLDPWGAYHFCSTLSGETLFLDGLEMNVIDVADPLQPRIIGTVGFQGRTYTVKGNMLLAADAEGINLYDITNPEPPSLAAFVETEEWGRDVAVEGDFAYLACDSDGLLVFQLGGPGDIPVQVGKTAETFFGTAIVIKDGLAYVADRVWGLRIFATEPTSRPPQLGYLTFALTSISDIDLWGDRVVLAHAEGAIVVDVSNPAAPVELARTDGSFYGRGVSVRNDLAYVGAGFDGLYVLDLTAPSLMPPAGWIDTPGYALRTAFYGDYGYLADRAEQVQVLDLSDPVSPQIVGRTLGFGGVYDVSVAGGRLYSSAGAEGLVIHGLANPARPKLAGAVNTPHGLGGAQIAGDRVVMADRGLAVDWVLCSDAVANYLTVFEARHDIESASVQLNWQVHHLDSHSNFRVSALLGNQTREVPHEATGFLTFEALHDVSAFGGKLGTNREIVYTLQQGTHGTDWWTLDEIALELPPLVTRPLAVHPNPFNPQAVITYSLPHAQHVIMTIHDLSGRKIASVVDGPQAAGNQSITWAGRDDSGFALASGAYFARLVTSDGIQVKKMLILK